MLESDSTWLLLIDLKDNVKLVAFPTSHTHDILTSRHQKTCRHRYMQVVPEVKILLKHRFIDHYPQLVKALASLVAIWMMFYEGRHGCFKASHSTYQLFWQHFTDSGCEASVHAGLPSAWQRNMSIVPLDHLKETCRKLWKGFLKRQAGNVMTCLSTSYSAGMILPYGCTGWLSWICWTLILQYNPYCAWLVCICCQVSTFMVQWAPQGFWIGTHEISPQAIGINRFLPHCYILMLEWVTKYRIFWTEYNNIICFNCPWYMNALFCLAHSFKRLWLWTIHVDGSLFERPSILHWFLWWAQKSEAQAGQLQSKGWDTSETTKATVSEDYLKSNPVADRTRWWKRTRKRK